MVYQPWSKSLLDNPGELERYIQYHITNGEFLNKASCEASGNSWRSVKVVRENGQFIMNCDICVGVEYESSKAYIIVFNNGNLQIKNLVERSVGEIVDDLLEAALRSAAILAAIGAGLGIDAIVQTITSINSTLGSIVSFVYDEVKPIVDRYQRSAAWIEETFHVDILKRIHTIGKVLSPEYRSVVSSYEAYLSKLSQQVFGNTASLNVYMRFYEAMLYDQMKRANIDNDTARYDSLKASYTRAQEIESNISRYINNPAVVWSDVYSWTFGDMNKYVDTERAERDKQVIQLLSDVAGIAKKLDDAVLNIGKFARILELDLNLAPDAPLKTLSDAIDGYYSEHIEPTVRAIESEERKLATDLKKIADTRERERLARERSFLIATPPGDLTPAQRGQQASHVNDLINSAILPETQEPPKVFTDIDVLMRVLYER